MTLTFFVIICPCGHCWWLFVGYVPWVGDSLYLVRYQLDGKILDLLLHRAGTVALPSHHSCVDTCREHHLAFRYRESNFGPSNRTVRVLMGC